MPRLKRVHLPNVLNYVTSRGDEERPLFEDAEDYCAYLRLVKHYKEQYGMKVYAYCLLPDSVHLCLEPTTEEGTISAFMHDVTSRYTKHYNKRYDRTGHLFLSRFKSIILENEAYLLPLTLYVHQLPLETGSIQNAAEYAFSSLASYCGAAENGLVSIKEEIAEVSARVSEESSAKSYAQYFESVPGIALESFRKELRHRIIGSDAFVHSIKQRLHSPQPKRPQRKINRVPFWQQPVARFALGAVSAAVLMVAGGLLATQRTQASSPPVPVMSTAAVQGVDMNRLMEQFRVALAEREAQTAQLNAGQPSQLGGTEWVIEIRPVGDVTAKSQRDYLIFENSEVVSLRFNAKGFPNARYTLKGQSGGVRVWKAMQTGSGGEVVTWRGEVTADGMTGIMVRKNSDGETRSYAFEGQNRLGSQF